MKHYLPCQCLHQYHYWQHSYLVHVNYPQCEIHNWTDTSLPHCTVEITSTPWVSYTLHHWNMASYLQSYTYFSCKVTFQGLHLFQINFCDQIFLVMVSAFRIIFSSLHLFFKSVRWNLDLSHRKDPCIISPYHFFLYLILNHIQDSIFGNLAAIFLLWFLVVMFLTFFVKLLKIISRKGEIMTELRHFSNVESGSYLTT